MSFVCITSTATEKEKLFFSETHSAHTPDLLLLLLLLLLFYHILAITVLLLLLLLVQRLCRLDGLPVAVARGLGGPVAAAAAALVPVAFAGEAAAQLGGGPGPQPQEVLEDGLPAVMEGKGEKGSRQNI